MDRESWGRWARLVIVSGSGRPLFDSTSNSIVSHLNPPSSLTGVGAVQRRGGLLYPGALHLLLLQPQVHRVAVLRPQQSDQGPNPARVCAVWHGPRVRGAAGSDHRQEPALCHAHIHAAGVRGEVVPGAGMGAIYGGLRFADTAPGRVKRRSRASRWALPTFQGVALGITVVWPLSPQLMGGIVG